MDIVVVGINHNKAPVNIRERVAFDNTSLELGYKKLKEEKNILECVIISTCNRSEIVAYVKNIKKGVHTLKNFYCDFFNIPLKDVEKYFLIEQSDEAVKHMYMLAAGLDSLILGEDQIIGQVRTAHEYALNVKSTSRVLNTLFRNIVTTGKKIKRETLISQNSLSISSIAVKFIEDKFVDLKDKRILVIGVGEMSRIAIENLIFKGVKHIYVTNRTVGHAIDLSNRYKEIRVIDFKNRYDAIKDVDIIISSTSAPHHVLKKDKFKECYDENKAICIVDIALPRDVDEEIKNLKNVFLYELDELKKVALDNMESRRNAAKDAMEIIIEESIKFQNWYNCIPVFPTIESLKNMTNTILTEELESLFTRLEGATIRDKELIEIVMTSLVKKIIKRPIHNLKMAGEDKQGQVYAKVINEMFSIKEYGCNKRGGEYGK